MARPPCGSRRGRPGGPILATASHPVPAGGGSEGRGELIHIDTKKLGRISRIGHRITGDRTGQSSNRGVGRKHLHVAVDDASRLAYTELLPDERKHSAVAFSPVPWPGLPATASPSNASSATTARPAKASCSPRPSKLTACATSASDPTRPRPMARRSASSRPVCADGHTPHPSTPQPIAPPPCRHGSATTPAADLTRLSPESLRSAASPATTSLAATSTSAAPSLIQTAAPQINTAIPRLFPQPVGPKLLVTHGLA